MHSIVSITTDQSLRYQKDQFGPVRQYPELAAIQAETGRNGVYDSVRSALEQAGLDAGRVGTTVWNPLGGWIKPGNRVFILPNFVRHARPDQTEEQFQATCTNASVLRPVVDYVLIATKDAACLGMGNAPLQSCDYSIVCRDTGVTQLAQYYRLRYGHFLGPHDLRGVVTRWNRVGALLSQSEPNVEITSIDLGTKSFLEPLFEDGRDPQVRVGDYDPKDIMQCHAPGRHIYIINRKVLDADVIISVPKLKTHQKVGVTCALKGLVGIVARKECLAHHRRGGPAEGGDEYLHCTWLNRTASKAADLTNPHSVSFLSNVARVLAKVGYRTARMVYKESGGGWYGNDTAWRMTLDLMYILEHARADGTLSDVPVRKHLVFIDGIMAGEGEGPLRPLAKPCGTILFSDNPVLADYVCAMLMGFDPGRLALITNALNVEMDGQATSRNARILLNGCQVSDPAALPNFGFKPPRGWVSHIERAAVAEINQTTECPA